MRARFAATLALATFAAMACVPKRAPVRAKQPLTVAVAGIFDRSDAQESGPLPEAASKRIAETLAARNLKPHVVGGESFVAAFQARRTTAHRLAALSDGADSDLLVLVETRVRFYSQLSGRYRWDVDARVTIARKGALDQATSASIQVPAFLDFDHEREPEALAVAGPRIADEVGRLADEFLGGLASVTRRGWVASAGDATDMRSASRGTAPVERVAAPVERVAAPVARGADSIYFVLIDRFANGDPANDGVVDPGDPQAFHGGDLAGVLAHLDELQDLGVRTVWLSPVFKMRTEKFHEFGAYHGYWVEDFDRLEPRFGSTELLAKLSAALHARGMRLLLDVVLNHVAPDAPLVKEHPDWFHRQGGITDWNDPVQLVMRDVYGLPDLAQENPAVYDYLLGRSLAWIERVHPDGFRLDAARHVPKSFWKKYDADVHAKAGQSFAMLGEMFDGSPASLAKTRREAGFDAVFDFPLYFAMNDVFCKDAPPSRLAATLFADRTYDDPSALVTFLDNHDLPRLASSCGKDPSRITQALTFLLTARGTPSLTYGTESGLTGEKEPENRGDMRFDPKNPLRATLRSLLGVRARSAALTGGSTRFLALDETLFAYARVTPGDAAVIAVNRGDHARTVELPDEMKGAVAVDTLTGASAELPLSVPARATRVVSLVPRKDGTFARAATPAPRDVEFRARANARGEQVFVVGSGPELGDWDPAKGVPLTAHDGSLTATVRLPAESAWEWKLVAKGADGALRWESGPNRALLVQPGSGAQVAVADSRLAAR